MATTAPATAPKEKERGFGRGRDDKKGDKKGGAGKFQKGTYKLFKYLTFKVKLRNGTQSPNLEDS